MQERTYITSLVDKAGHPSKKQSSIMGWFSLFALAVLGFFFVLLLTPHGAGATPDSVLYLDGARNLLRGFGYVSSLPHDQVKPITRWPPLFSSTLALIGLSGVDPRIAARWLNSFLMGFNILLTGHLVKRYANGSWLASALAATLLLVSYNFLRVHSMILSEPLFVALTLVGFVFLMKHLERPRAQLLIASALFISLAAMTRYFGIPVGAAGVLSLLLLKPGNMATRVRDGVCFAVITATPVLGFFVRNRIIADSAIDVTPTYLGFPPGMLERPIHVCANWFCVILAPHWLPTVLVWLETALWWFVPFYAVLLLARRARRDKAAKMFICFVVLQSICYFFFYVLSCLFFSHDTCAGATRYMTALSPLVTALFVLFIAEHLNLTQSHRLLMILAPYCAFW